MTTEQLAEWKALARNGRYHEVWNSPVRIFGPDWTMCLMPMRDVKPQGPELESQ